MNRKYHERLGLFAGTGAAAYHAQGLHPLDASLEILGGALVSRFAGRGPDLIEPAYHPRHRSFAHSRAVQAGTTYLALSRDGPLARAQKALRAEADRQRLLANNSSSRIVSIIRRAWGWLLRLASGALVAVPAAYASHLYADSTTPAGLPLISRRFG